MGVGARGVAGALPDIARDVEARLRERGDDGDDELADALAGALGGTVPALRPIPVLLDEVADLVSGDPSRDTGGWIDLRTGEVWDASGLDWMDADERPDFDDEPEIRAEWFGFGDERERGRARALLAARGDAPAPRLD